MDITDILAWVRKAKKLTEQVPPRTIQINTNCKQRAAWYWTKWGGTMAVLAIVQLNSRGVTEHILVYDFSQPILANQMIGYRATRMFPVGVYQPWIMELEQVSRNSEKFSASVQAVFDAFSRAIDEDVYEVTGRLRTISIADTMGIETPPKWVGRDDTVAVLR